MFQRKPRDVRLLEKAFHAKARRAVRIIKTDRGDVAIPVYAIDTEPKIKVLPPDSQGVYVAVRKNGRIIGEGVLK